MTSERVRGEGMRCEKLLLKGVTTPPPCTWSM